MATAEIQNGAIAGAMAAIMAGRAATDDDPADFASVANAADAFSDAFLTANAALNAPMADADNANIIMVCYGASFAVLTGRNCVSTDAADYADVAAGAVAIAKETEAKLV